MTDHEPARTDGASVHAASDDVLLAVDGAVTDRRVPLGAIRADQKAQPRTSIDAKVVAEFAAAMGRGETFPPLEVFFDGQVYHLGDGFHRFAAAVARYASGEFECVVHRGGLREAILFSTGANSRHGVRRTRDDKRRALTTLLTDPEWAAWSNNQIALQCNVDNRMVSQYRARLASLGAVPSEGHAAASHLGASQGRPRLVRRGNVVYTQNTARCGLDRSSSVAPEKEEPVGGPVASEAAGPPRTELARYDAMLRAIEAAYEVDEVKDIRDKAIAFEVYSRQAKNKEAERQACEIRLRAERKAGEISSCMETAPGMRTDKPRLTRGRGSKAERLSKAGVSKKQAENWEKLANVPDEKFESALADKSTMPTTSGILRAANAVTIESEIVAGHVVDAGDEPITGAGRAIEPEEISSDDYRAAFYARVTHAKNFAFYSGPITRDTLTAAAGVARKWDGLTRALEFKYDPRVPVDARASNALHRELMGFLPYFERKFRAWLETKPSEEALTSLHGALRIAGDECYRLSEEMPAPAEAETEST